MKKISLIAFAIFTTASLFAQDAKFGLKAGLNVSTLSNTNGSEYGSKVGFNAGALAHIHLSPSWSLQPEVVYSAQGTKYTVGETEHALNLGYINIPLQLQYNFDNGFRLQTGPQVGFLTNVNDKVNGAETQIFTTDDFKSVDFSWTAGLGYLTYSGFGVDARYNFGLSDINDNGVNRLRNNVFQVGVFYLLDHNHKAMSR
jgi:hypothetical protein